MQRSTRKTTVFASFLLAGLACLAHFAAPTAQASVDIVVFQTAVQDNKIAINWETENELNHLGFNLWRTEIQQSYFEDIPFDSRQKVNSSLIYAQGSVGSMQYNLIDSEVVTGKTYFYWLESVDIQGISQYTGPRAASLSGNNGGLTLPTPTSVPPTSIPANTATPVATNPNTPVATTMATVPASASTATSTPIAPTTTQAATVAATTVPPLATTAPVATMTTTTEAITQAATATPMTTALMPEIAAQSPTSTPLISVVQSSAAANLPTATHSTAPHITKIGENIPPSDNNTTQSPENNPKGAPISMRTIGLIFGIFVLVALFTFLFFIFRKRRKST